MSSLKQFRLPDVGEGLTEADIVRWHVAPGDEVTINQVIVEIETAKAVVELPSPYAGVVDSLLVPEGTTADVGTPIISVRVGDDAGEPGSDAAGGGAGTAPGPGPEPVVSADAEGQSLLVGYGVRPESGRRRRRQEAGQVAIAPAQIPEPITAPVSRPAIGVAAAPGAMAATGGQPTASEATAGSGEPMPGGPAMGRALAKPPVRKLARDLGVDLVRRAGTGPGGSITRSDVEAAAGLAGTAATTAPPTGTGASGEMPAAAAAEPGRTARLASLPREERIAVRGVRKHTAAAVTASAFTAPHVTEFLRIDISETMAAVTRLRSLPEFEGIRVSPLLLVARALLIAAERHPMINSTWDEPAGEIVVKRYVNLGIAAATDRGLVVPNIKDAHALTLPGLARALADLTETARQGRATPADLSGGTITITNVGVFGVDSGTPIITPGEAAILAFGQVRQEPWVVDGALAIRWICTLSLSFDHRIADGELGSAVLRDVGAMLTDPIRMLAWS